MAIDASDSSNPGRSRDLTFACESWQHSRLTCTPLCADYHQVRPVLRALGMVADPHDQAQFFQRQINLALASGANSVLVSGTSDTGMPELTAKAVSGRATIDIIDLCPTPLALVTAQLGNNSVHTEPADILNWQPRKRFDLIVTHSFFGHFAPALRPVLLQAWHSLLSPGGFVVTANRIRQSGGEAGFSGDGSMALANEAVRRFEAVGGSPHLSSNDLHAAVRSYARNRRTNPVTSSEEFLSGFTDAGFEIVETRTEKAPARAAGISGPAISNGGTYCLIAARRPR